MERAENNLTTAIPGEQARAFFETKSQKSKLNLGASCESYFVHVPILMS